LSPSSIKAKASREDGEPGDRPEKRPETIASADRVICLAHGKVAKPAPPRHLDLPALTGLMRLRENA
jgi:hypothetical protein